MGPPPLLPVRQQHSHATGAHAVATVMGWPARAPLPTLDLPFSFPGRASTHNEHSQVCLACFISSEQQATLYRSTLWYCATAIFTQCHNHSRTCHQRLYHIQCSHAGADIHTPVLGTLQTARLCYNGCAVMSGRPLINLCQSPSSTIPTSGYSPRLRRCN